jgi:uncharacterized protein YgiM (DUF1202 family)
MKGIFFFVMVALILFFSASQAGAVYVIDSFKIMVRRQPGDKYKIISQLPSNEKVTLIKTEGDWAKISFKNNQTGWVLRRYLAEEVPKPIQIAKLEKQVKGQEEKIGALDKENISLKQKNAELAETLAVETKNAKDVLLENQTLKEKPYRIVLLLSGGGIFLVGCMVTLIIQRTGRGKKKNKLSF